MEGTQVILVNELDHPLGLMEKLEVHEKGLLHRAFSIFIFNTKGEMLLQQRASNKYHSSRLWTNACCSHPVPGEEMIETAQRRLQEEMGFDTKLEKVFDFIYRSEFENGLTEYEFDHVFVGEYDGIVQYSQKEVMDYCFKEVSDIRQTLQSHPEKFSSWFHIAFPRMEEWWYQRYKNQVA